MEPVLPALQDISGSDVDLMAGVSIKQEESGEGGGAGGGAAFMKTSPSLVDWSGSQPVLEVRQLTPPLSCSPLVSSIISTCVFFIPERARTL